MRKDDEVMNQFQGLTADDLAGFEAKYMDSALCRAITNVLYKHSVKDAAFCHESLAKSQYAFSPICPPQRGHTAGPYEYPSSIPE